MPHRVPRLLCLVLGWLAGAAAAPARADDGPKGHASIRFLTEMNTVPLTIETDPFVAWVKPVIAAAEARFPKEPARQSIVVQVTLRVDGPAAVELAGNPKLSAADVEALAAAADPAKAPRSKVATCSFRVVVKDKEGEPDDLPGLVPALKAPRERLLEQVKSAPTRDGLALLKGWAVAESLPLLAASAGEAEEKYTGVRNLGAALKKALADPKSPLDVETLATRNPDFWQATLEMQPGNPLTPAVESSLLLASGRVEWAQQVASLARPFDRNQSGNSDLLAFGRVMAEAYLEGVNRRIRDGIALNDKGRFDDALAAFDAVLKDDPRSAWALYERFHTERTKAMHADPKAGSVRSDLWPTTRAKILASNPLYQTMGEAHGAEGLFDLTRRVAIAGLFKDPKAQVKDLIAYADVAMDLNAFDMAAMLYWSILTGIKPEDYDNRPLLESFLYCLDRLGVRGLKENFRGDHAAAFAVIKADRAARVKSGLNPPKADTPGAAPKPEAPPPR